LGYDPAQICGKKLCFQRRGGKGLLQNIRKNGGRGGKSGLILASFLHPPLHVSIFWVIQLEIFLIFSPASPLVDDGIW
jgi:hypothetical protein